MAKSKMRPHTRTQCQQKDGPNACEECSGQTSSNSFLVPPTATCDGLPALPVGSARGRHFSSMASNMSSVSTANHRDEKRAIILVELPAELLVKILGYLSFNDISGARMVSRRFNELCASMLNSTFQNLQNSMLQRFQSIKNKMPRRESARRNHPLARECDIIETLHMRLTLLQMTFGKHIDRKYVCFFAGEILDEVYRIMRYIKSTPNLAGAYKVTDEIFDLSTMAMEYFKEKLEPTLPEITFHGTEYPDFPFPFSSPSKKRIQSGSQMSLIDSPSCSSSGSSIAGSGYADSGGCSIVSSGIYDEEEEMFNTNANNGSSMVLRKKIRKIRLGMKRYDEQFLDLKKELKATKSKLEAQLKQNAENSQRFEEYDKKFEEASRKLQSILTELNKCKTELQFWRSKSSVLLSIPTSRSVCSKCETNSIFSPAKDNVDESEMGSGLQDQNRTCGAASGAHDDNDDSVSLASACASDISGVDFKALINQGIFLPEDLGVMTRHMTSGQNEVAGLSSQNASNNSLGVRSTCTRGSMDGGTSGTNSVSFKIKEGSSDNKGKPSKESSKDIGSPSSPRPVTRSRPPSPTDGSISASVNVPSSRKRKIPDEETTRKSLRGAGVKNNKKSAKRPKVC